MDWKWQIAHAVRSFEDMPGHLAARVTETQLESVTAAFPMAITPYYLTLMDPRDPQDPIARMAVPHHAELQKHPGLEDDPIRETAHSPVPGLIRRYPDRALLLVSGECAVYCRHCTRRQLGRRGLRPMTLDGLSSAFDYLKKEPEIRDVIISGGDPLLLEDEQIVSILRKTREIPHVEIIRIGTRTPVVLPMRITEQLAKRLREFQPIYVNTQFNHPREITPESTRAIALLVDAGIPVANQAVLLRGVNDSPHTIEQLVRALVKMRVRPYYLFLCDLWPSLEHMRTTIQTGIDILSHLRGRVSGLAIPTLIADLPGGIGKIPIGPEYIVSKGDGVTVLRSPGGDEVVYPDPTP